MTVVSDYPFWEVSHATELDNLPGGALQTHDYHSDFDDCPCYTEMSSCKLKFMRNSPLRTTLVDDVTGHVKYRIETPIRIARSVTRIRKSKSSTPSPIHFDEDANDEEETIFHEINDEIARIYWKWFSSDKIIFRGRITVRSEFLLKCGKLKG